MKKICTIKAVQQQVDVSKTKASDMMRLCRDALGKEKNKPLYLHEFVDYYDLD